MTVNSEWLAMPALQNGSLLARQSPHTASGGQVRVEAALPWALLQEPPMTAQPFSEPSSASVRCEIGDALRSYRQLFVTAAHLTA